MKKTALTISIFLILITAVYAGYFAYKNLRGVKPAILPSKQDIVEIIDNKNSTSTTNTPGKNNTEFPLKLPDNFEISVLAKGLPKVRDLTIHVPSGDIWATRTSDNALVKIQIDKEGKSQIFTVTQSLNRPHGLAFDPQDQNLLYIAEETRISRTRINGNGPIEKVVDLPTGGRHFTRSLEWDSQGNLYVSIGSTCDVCHEQDSRIATVMKVNLQEKKLEPYATGLRNAVFMAKHPNTGEIWVTEMGRDRLGDELPPDEINILKQGNFGWPICYGKNIHDTNFDKNTYIRNPCMEPTEVPSYIDLPAHSAPLGLSFIPEQGWPEEYQNDLLVAYHGSWNRSEPTGYKIVRIQLDKDGKLVSGEKGEDFISGWLTKDNSALGRPVDVLALPNGVLYISDDKAGVIYKVMYQKLETGN